MSIYCRKAKIEASRFVTLFLKPDIFYPSIGLRVPKRSKFSEMMKTATPICSKQTRSVRAQVIISLI